MTTVSLVTRQRTRERIRPRPNARGNYVTLRVFATVFSLTFQSTDAAYIQWIPYVFPSTKAIGTFDDPPPVPPLVPVGPVAQINTIPQIITDIPGAEPIIPVIPGFEIGEIPTLPTPIPLEIPTNIPDGVNPVQTQAFQGGDAFQVDTLLTEQVIFAGKLPTKQVFLKAKSTNAGDIWFGFKQTVAIDNGWQLEPGEGVVLNLADISQIFFVGSVAADKLQVMYFV